VTKTRHVQVAAAILLAVAASRPAIAAGGPEDAARASAASWLALVDQQKYDESWEQAAKLFKGAVTKDQWQSAAAAARGPLGKLVSRKIKSSQYTEQLPGAPDGRYVVIQYDSAFEKKALAIETVTPMVDPDGNWRVSGYFVR
jgi:Protein of unknown function (DUF4019)